MKLASDKNVSNIYSSYLTQTEHVNRVRTYSRWPEHFWLKFDFRILRILVDRSGLFNLIVVGSLCFWRKVTRVHCWHQHKHFADTANVARLVPIYESAKFLSQQVQIVRLELLVAYSAVVECVLAPTTQRLQTANHVVGVFVAEVFV